MSTTTPDIPCVAAQSTADSRELADKLAAGAVEARLAACVQISEITSFYSWDGAVQHDVEFLLTFKTTAQVAAAPLRDFVEREHPYDEPEFVVLPMIGGSESYLRWIRESVASMAS